MNTHKIAILLTTLALFSIACATSDQSGDTESSPVDSIVVEQIGRDSVSAFDLLLADHMVNYKQTASGAFVTGIDSVKVGGGYFWLYSVNDSMPKTAADNYITSEGDTVRWIFRKQ